MPSVTDICNSALAEVGDYRILDINDDSNQARACLAAWDGVRDEVLRGHPWNCAMFRTTIASAEATPKWGFGLAYKLPTDPYCLRIWRLSNRRTEYKIIGREIHTNAEAPLEIEYIGRVTDPNIYDALLYRALSVRLAGAIAYRLTSSNKRVEVLERKFEKIMAGARTADAQEGTPEEAEAEGLLEARY